MWKIIYTVDFHYQDNNNYPVQTTGECEYVMGKTIDSAIEKLISTLEKGKDLTSIVDAMAVKRRSYDSAYSLDIVSCDEVKNSVDLDIFKHPSFKVLIDNRKKEREHQEKAKKKRSYELQKQHDLREIKRLQEKYKT